MKSRILFICPACGQSTIHYAKGLCRKCWTLESRHVGMTASEVLAERQCRKDNAKKREDELQEIRDNGGVRKIAMVEKLTPIPDFKFHTDHQNQMYDMLVNQNKSYNEIAAELGITRQAVSNALNKMVDQIEKRDIVKPAKIKMIKLKPIDIFKFESVPVIDNKRRNNQIIKYILSYDGTYEFNYTIEKEIVNYIKAGCSLKTIIAASNCKDKSAYFFYQITTGICKQIKEHQNI